MVRSATIDEILDMHRDGKTIRIGKTIMDPKNRRQRLIRCGTPLRINGRSAEDARYYLWKLASAYREMNPDLATSSRLPIDEAVLDKAMLLASNAEIKTFASFTDITDLDTIADSFYTSITGYNINKILKNYPVSDQDLCDVAEVITVAARMREGIRKKGAKSSISNRSLVPSAILTALEKYKDEDWYKGLFHDLQHDVNAVQAIILKVNSEVNGCLPANVLKIAKEYIRLIKKDELAPLEAVVYISGRVQVKNGEVERQGLYDSNVADCLFQDLVALITNNEESKYYKSKTPELLRQTIVKYHDYVRSESPVTAKEKLIGFDSAIDEVFKPLPRERLDAEKTIREFMLNYYFEKSEVMSFEFERLSTEQKKMKIKKYTEQLKQMPVENVTGYVGDLPEQIRPTFDLLGRTIVKYHDFVKSKADATAKEKITGLDSAIKETLDEVLKPFSKERPEAEKTIREFMLNNYLGREDVRAFEFEQLPTEQKKMQIIKHAEQIRQLPVENVAGYVQDLPLQIRPAFQKKFVAETQYY